MKIQYYCYTRNVKLDYGDYLLPSNLSNNQLIYVQKKIFSVIADKKIKFSNPKWVLIKYEDVIVWGVCGWNLLLSESNFKDHMGRPVYGFFSLVISEFQNENIKVPYDVEYFKQLYAERIAPYWHSRKICSDPITGYIGGNFNYISAIQGNYVNLLNTDNFKCKSLGELDIEEVISAALTLDNVSLIINNDNIEQAINRDGSFMNCLSSSVGIGLYQVNQQCPNCKKYVSSFTQKGVCIDCKETKEIIRHDLKKDEANMDKQMRDDLENANKRIIELELEVEAKRSQIKKINCLLIILVFVFMLLLIAFVSEHNLLPIKLINRV